MHADLTLPLLFLANPFILSSVRLTLIFLAYLMVGGGGGEERQGGWVVGGGGAAERGGPFVEKDRYTER